MLPLVLIDTENAVSRVGPGFAAMDSALQTLGDKASTADEKLSAMLKAEGFPVARRTVAKYRGLANIPGTSERRSAS